MKSHICRGCHNNLSVHETNCKCDTNVTLQSEHSIMLMKLVDETLWCMEIDMVGSIYWCDWEHSVSDSFMTLHVNISIYIFNRWE